MTTLAFDGRIMAADTMITGFHDGIRFAKLYVAQQGKNVLCIGGCGVAAMLAPSIAWFLEDGNPANYPSTDLKMFIAQNQQGSLSPRSFIVESNGARLPAPAPHAEGSGADVCLGAMLAGKNAIEAIKIAARNDPGTNDEVIGFDMVEMRWVQAPTQTMQDMLQDLINPYLKPRRAARRKTRK